MLVNYQIRSLTPQDQAFLREMVYHAIFVPEGESSPPRDIVNLPEIARYVENWGQPADLGFAAVEVDSQQSIGAAWLRKIRGYAYVDDATPELTIALLPEHRSQGVGTQLLEHTLAAAKEQYPGVSLSVSSRNPARFLYQRMGFEIIHREERTLTMLSRF